MRDVALEAFPKLCRQKSELSLHVTKNPWGRFLSPGDAMTGNSGMTSNEDYTANMEGFIRRWLVEQD
jgi:hypothetical protein